jgi:hypothetical protein
MRREPVSSRLSSSAVCTVTSARASSRHSSMVRTEEPISRPMSQQAVMKPSIVARSASGVQPGGVPGAGLGEFGSRTRTSTSEYGNSSPRP